MVTRRHAAIVTAVVALILSAIAVWLLILAIVGTGAFPGDSVGGRWTGAAVGLDAGVQLPERDLASWT